MSDGQSGSVSLIFDPRILETPEPIRRVIFELRTISAGFSDPGNPEQVPLEEITSTQIEREARRIAEIKNPDRRRTELAACLHSADGLAQRAAQLAEWAAEVQAFLDQFSGVLDSADRKDLPIQLILQSQDSNHS